MRSSCGFRGRGRRVVVGDKDECQGTALLVSRVQKGREWVLPSHTLKQSHCYTHLFGDEQPAVGRLVSQALDDVPERHPARAGLVGEHADNGDSHARGLEGYVEPGRILGVGPVGCGGCGCAGKGGEEVGGGEEGETATI